MSFNRKLIGFFLLNVSSIRKIPYLQFSEKTPVYVHQKLMVSKAVVGAKEHVIDCRKSVRIPEGDAWISHQMSQRLNVKVGDHIMVKIYDRL